MTNYSEIFELMLAGLQDYKINKLFNQSQTQAEDYLQSFLIRGLINFTNCQKDLEDRDDVNKRFNQTLNTDEKVILSNLSIIEWLRKEVNDVLQMKIVLNDTDFKTYSSAQNLKEKREHFDKTKEEVDKQINAYGYKYFNWNSL